MTDARTQICPRCGHPNPEAAILCLNRRCRWLLSNPDVPKKHQMASGTPGSPWVQKEPSDVQSVALQNETASEWLVGDGLDPHSALTRRKGGGSRPPRRHWGVWIWLALPGALLAGYLHSLGQVRSVGSPPAAIQHTVSTSPSASPTRVARSRFVSPPSIHTQSTPAPGVWTLRGTIRQGQLVTRVWAGVSPNGPIYPVRLMVDTGAVHTMVSGNFWQAMGDQPTGQTETFQGIGGQETVGLWPHVWVFPQDSPSHPLIANATEPGGLNRSMLQGYGVLVLLGQDILSQGTLTQNGDTWQFTYAVP